MSKLFQSRKFLLVVLDAVVVVVAVVVAKFVPEWSEFVGQVTIPVTAVITAAIIGIAYEDGQALKAGSHPNQG